MKFKLIMDFTNLKINNIVSYQNLNKIMKKILTLTMK